MSRSTTPTDLEAGDGAPIGDAAGFEVRDHVPVYDPNRFEFGNHVPVGDAPGLQVRDLDLVGVVSCLEIGNPSRLMAIRHL